MKAAWIGIALMVWLAPAWASAAFTAGDQHGGDINITSSTTLSGFYYNVGTFTVPQKCLNASGKQDACVVTAGTSGVYVQADNIVVNGTIDATGQGMPGGKGGSCGTGGQPGSTGQEDPDMLAYFTDVDLSGQSGAAGAAHGVGSDGKITDIACEPGYWIAKFCIGVVYPKFSCHGSMNPFHWTFHCDFDEWGCLGWWAQLNWCWDSLGQIGNFLGQDGWGPPFCHGVASWLWDCRHSGEYCGSGGGGGGGGGSYGTLGCFGQRGSFGANGVASSSDVPNQLHCSIGGLGGNGGYGGGASMSSSGSNIVFPAPVYPTNVVNAVEAQVFRGSGGGGGGGGGAAGGVLLDNCTEGGRGGAGGGRIILEALKTMSVASTGQILANGVQGSPGGIRAKSGGKTGPCDCKDKYQQDQKILYLDGGDGGGGGGGSGGGILVSAPAMSILGAKSLQANGAPGRSRSSTDSITSDVPDYGANANTSKGGAGGAGAIKVFVRKNDIWSWNNYTLASSFAQVLGCTNDTKSRAPVVQNNLVWVTVMPVNVAAPDIPILVKHTVNYWKDQIGAKAIPMLRGHTYPLSTYVINTSTLGATYSFINYDFQPDDQGVPIVNYTFPVGGDATTATIRIFFKKLGFYNWKGRADNDFENYENWDLVDEAGVATPLNEGEWPPPDKYKNVLIRVNSLQDATTGFWPEMHGTHAYFNPLMIDPIALQDSTGRDAGIYWRSGESSSYTFGSVTLDQKANWHASPSDLGGATQNTFTANGAFIVQGDAVFDSTRTAVYANSDVIFDTGASILHDVSDTAKFAFSGSNNTHVRALTKTLSIPWLSFEKTDASKTVTFDSDIGPTSLADSYGEVSGGTGKMYIGKVSVVGGIVNLNGHALTAANQVEITGVSQLNLGYDSTSGIASSLRIFGRDGTLTPLVINTTTKDTVALLSNQGSLHIGPFVDPMGSVTAIPVTGVSGLPAISLSATSAISMTNGGSFISDSLATGGGWDINIGANANWILQGLTLQTDHNLAITNPAVLNLVGTAVKTGCRTASGIDTYLDGVGHLTNSNPTAGNMLVGTDTSFSVGGNFLDVGAFQTTTSGTYPAVTMNGNNTSFSSSNTFAAMKVIGNPVTLNSQAKGIPTFLTGIDINPGRLIVPPLGVVVLGNGARINVYGTLTSIGTDSARVTFRTPDSSSHYQINVMGANGMIAARYTDFYYLGGRGIDISQNSTTGIDPNNSFANCHFLYPDTQAGTTVLTVENSQTLYVDNARFVSSLSTTLLSQDVINVSRTKADGTGNDGYLIFRYERCSSAETAASGLCDSTAHADMSGERYENDPNEHVIWTIVDPAVTKVLVANPPLNSELAQMTIYAGDAGNSSDVTYCLWASDETDTTRDYIKKDATGAFTFGGTACAYFTMTQLGSTSGFKLNGAMNKNYRLHMQGYQSVPVTPAYVQYSGYANVFTTDVIPDRMPPTVPSAVVATASTGVGDDHMNLTWGQSVDTDSNHVDYVLWRGRGDSLGEIDAVSNPYGKLPSAYEPVNGVFDTFATSANWTVMPSSTGFDFTNQKLTVTGSATETRRAILSKAINVGSGAGYVMQVDFTRTAGSDAVHLLFPFKGSTGTSWHLMRWAIGKTDGTATNLATYSYLFYGLGTLDNADGSITTDESASDGSSEIITSDTYGTAYTLSSAIRHQAMVYVRGGVARGYIDGVQLWSIDFASITGDASIGLENGFGAFVPAGDIVEFDNFMVAPFIPIDSDAAPAYADTSAKDDVGPFTPGYASGQALATGIKAVALSFLTPQTPKNEAATKDRAASYWYGVQAFDLAGNSSNLIFNRGFEGPNVKSGTTLWSNVTLEQTDDPNAATNAGDHFEGSYVGQVTNPSLNGEYAVQNIGLNGIVPVGGALRYSRYARIVTISPGNTLLPGRLVVAYDNGTGTTYDGQSLSAVTGGWIPINNDIQAPFGTSAKKINSVKVLSTLTSGAPTLTFWLDQARLDVYTGGKVAEGFKYTQVQVRLDSNTNACTGWNTLSHTTEDTLTDVSFTYANQRHFYRFRSCDSANTANCGPWMGGVPCTDFASASDCPSGQGFTACRDFSDDPTVKVGYCTSSDLCLPGVARYSMAAQEEAPLSSILHDAVGQPINQALHVEWDNDGVSDVDHVGTEFLVTAFASTTPGNCGKTGSDWLGYLSADGKMVDKTNTSPTDASVAAYWSTTRSRDVSALASNRYTCFRVLARNGDKVLVKDALLLGWGNDWAGWSPLSNELLPPATPAVVPQSLTFAYGTNSGDTKRAMPVDGKTEQVLTFTFADDNNINDGSYNYNDVAKVYARISPHASWTHTSAFFSGHTDRRGYFEAIRSGNSWSIQLANPDDVRKADMKDPRAKDSGDPSDWGNDRVTLDVAGSSVVRDAVDPTKWDVTIKWSLIPLGTDTRYGSVQDQGVEVRLEDSQGSIGSWDKNAFGDCTRVFHTSYPPTAPALVAPANNSPLVSTEYYWTNVHSLDFSANGPLDNDRAELADLYGDASNGCVREGLCVAWGLTSKYNCLDHTGSVGDDVYYRVELTKNVDSDQHCTGTPSLTLDYLKMDRAETNDYRMTRTANLDTVTDDGVYHWCVKAKDQHSYEALGSAVSDYATTQVARTIGIDRVPPEWQKPTSTNPGPFFKIFASVKNADGSSTQNDVTSMTGIWQFGNSPVFRWKPAVRDPKGIGEQNTAPIYRYYTTLKDSLTGNSESNPVADGAAAKSFDPANLGSDGWYEDNYAGQTLTYGYHTWCIQAVDLAGNASDRYCFYLNIDQASVRAPIIDSPTHPNPLLVYQNTTASGQNYQAKSLAPVFHLTDPTVDNFATFQGIYGSTECPDKAHCNLSWTPIHTYSFVLSSVVGTNTGASPDDWPEDDNTGHMITTTPSTCTDAFPACPNPVCDVNASCMDTNDQLLATNQQLKFSFGQGNINAPASDTGEDANLIYHYIAYYLLHGQQSAPGSYMYHIKGTTDAGGKIAEGTFQINANQCTKDNCDQLKARRNARLNETPMAFFAGGSSAGTDGKAGENLMPFYLDRTEVTNAAYADCVADAVCSAPDAKTSATRASYYGNPDYADYPMVNVNWDMASAYCSWLDKRLPTEDEWLFAADAEAQPGLALNLTTVGVAVKDTVLATQAKGISAYSTSPLHLLDNVSEWVSDWWLPEGVEADVKTMDTSAMIAACEGFMGYTKSIGGNPCVRKVVRGGSFQSVATPEARDAYAPAVERTDIGFRCAKDVFKFDTFTAKPATAYELKVVNGKQNAALIRTDSAPLRP